MEKQQQKKGSSKVTKQVTSTSKANVKKQLRTQSVSPQVKIFERESIANEYQYLTAFASPTKSKSQVLSEHLKQQSSPIPNSNLKGDSQKNKIILPRSGMQTIFEKGNKQGNAQSTNSSPIPSLASNKMDGNAKTSQKNQYVLDSKSNSTANALKDAEKKSKKKTALKDLKPLNLEKEKELFFQSEFTYNPTFLYQLSDINLNYAVPHTKYYTLALKILKEVIEIYGSENAYNEKEGGPIIDQIETTTSVQKYIKDLECEELVTFDFQYNTISPTCCQHSKDGTSKVVMGLPILYRELRIQGVLNHEIGTHFLRKHNERQQIWSKQRKKYSLEPSSKVEEGLALINQKFDTALNLKQKPYVFNAALHYYASVKSSQMSFTELFTDLEKFVSDPDKRWRECVRVKRGVVDTSQHLGMYKDQIYLIGIRRVIKYRHKCDLLKLHAGKITVKDCIKLSDKNLINIDKIKVPYFLKDIDLYKKALDRIASVNFMSDIK